MNEEKLDIVEEVEESVEIQETATEEIQEQGEELLVEEESTALTPVEKKMKKHQAAKVLVAEAKEILNQNENQLNECKLLLENDLRAYSEAKDALKLDALNDAKALLTQLGYASTEGHLDIDEADVVFEPNEEMDKVMQIRDVSSGRFTGFMLSLVAGAATLGGLVYWATEKLDMTLDISKVPNNDTMNSIANYYSQLVNAGDNPAVGLGLIALGTVAVMGLAYILRVGLKGGSNLRFASEQMKETQKHVTQKANCKIEMDRVDAHMTDAIETLKDYQVLLVEQNGTLKRILHFEGNQKKELGYSLHAKNEMKKTENLITKVQLFMNQSMSHHGKLAEESVTLLDDAKQYIKEVLSKLS